MRLLVAALAAAAVSAQDGGLTGGGDVESALAGRLTSPVAQAPCVRLLSEAGDVGCSTGPGGVTGYLYLADAQADVDRFGSLPSAAPRAVLLPPALVTAANLAALAATPSFVGALVAPGPLAAAAGGGGGWSPEAPSLPVGGPGARVWNPPGLNLTSTRWRFPVVALTDAASAASLRAAAASNAGAAGDYSRYPQQAVRLFFYMGPDGLTPTRCLGPDDQSCLPVGGQSVWATLGPMDAAGQMTANGTVPVPPGSPARRQRPVVLGVAPLDAPGGLFHPLAVGADATATGLVALLAAAAALGATPSAFNLPLQIAFAAFQGEWWGRVGSRRWLSELGAPSTGGFNCSDPVGAADSVTGAAFCAWPLRTSLAFTALQPSDIAAVLGADQVGRPSLAGLTLHTWDGSAAGSSSSSSGGGSAAAPIDVAGVVNATAAAAAAAGALGPLTAPLAPPSSPAPSPPPHPVLTFTEETAPATTWLSQSLRVGLLAGYDSSFTSAVYGSQFDNATAVDAARVTAAATLLARSLYALATNASTPAAAAAAVPPALVANATLVGGLLACLTVSADCALFASLLGLAPGDVAAYLPPGPLSLYASVYFQPYAAGANGYALAPKPVEAVARNLLAAATAVNTTTVPGGCNATADCAAAGLGPAAECLVGVCVVDASAYYHDALSPAVNPVADSYGVFTVNASALTPWDPAWSEPYWSNAIGATTFLQDDAATQGGVLAAGVVTALASIAGAFYLTRFMDAHYKVG
jgi:hypothetical protein